MNPFRFLAGPRRRSPPTRSRPSSTRLHIESLEQRTLLAIDAMATGGASPWQNAALPADVNADGHVTAQDAMAVLNALNDGGARSLATSVGRTAFFASSLRTAANSVDAAPSFVDTNGDGMLTGLDVLLVINQLNESAEQLVRVRLEVTDTAGNPITQVNVGDGFQVRAYVFDLRPTGNTGVFEAFTDVTYNAALASVAGAIVHAPDYLGTASGDATTAGLLNEVGGLSGITPLGPEERLLFTVPFTATAGGTLNFTADPADFIGNDMLLFDMTPVVPIPPEQVMYGATSVNVIGPPSISVADATHAEGDAGTTALEFTVTLSAEWTDPVSVDFQAIQDAGDSGVSGVDFAPALGTLTFTPGETSKIITVDILGDTLNEANETLHLHLTSPANGVLFRSAALGTIQNDDPLPTVSIDSPAGVTENAGVTPIVFTVSLSAISSFDVVVPFSTSNGTATGGQDYVTQTSGMLTVQAGQLTGTVSIGLLDDSVDEGDQTFAVTLGTPTNATIATGQGVGTGTILDDDPAPTISIADASVTEGNSGTTPMTFVVTLSAVSELDVTVAFETEDDTALMAQDYDFKSGMLTIPAGQTSGMIAVDVRGDFSFEQDEAFRVVLSAPNNGSIDDGTATGTITNDDLPLPTLSIAGPTSGVAENAQPAVLVFTVTLSAPSTDTVTVDFTTEDGAAHVGADYVLNSGTLTFLPLETSKTIEVSLLDDVLDEANAEDVRVRLSNPQVATIASAESTGDILDDDPMPTLSIGDASVLEGDNGTATLQLTVSISAASGLPVSFDYRTSDVTALAGSDYTAVNTEMAGQGRVTILPGATTATISIDVHGDLDIEPDETLLVTLVNPDSATLGDAEATGTIINDDPPSISIADATVTEGNSGTVQMQFTVTLNKPNPLAPITVQFQTQGGSATLGVDFVDASGSLTFDPNETTKMITVDINGDTLSEANETFLVNLTNPSGAILGRAQATGTITDDDPLPTVSINSPTAVTENAGVTPIVFTVTLSAESGQDVLVPFSTANATAMAGQDYVAQTNGMLTIPAGQLTGTISIALLDDTADEPDQTFNVVLGTPIGATVATGTGVGTILDNDAPPTISIANSSVAEGNAGMTPLLFTVSLSAASDRDVSVDLETLNGTALAGTDYEAKNDTLVIPAGQTSGTITVNVLGDTTHEDDKTFTLDLSAPVNGVFAGGATTATATGTITDDDPSGPDDFDRAPLLSQVAENGGLPLVFEVTLSTESDQTVTVDFAVNDVNAVQRRGLCRHDGHFDVRAAREDQAHSGLRDR